MQSCIWNLFNIDCQPICYENEMWEYLPRMWVNPLCTEFVKIFLYRLKARRTLQRLNATGLNSTTVTEFSIVIEFRRRTTDLRTCMSWWAYTTNNDKKKQCGRQSECKTHLYVCALVLYSLWGLEQWNAKSSDVIWKISPRPQKNSIVNGYFVRVRGFGQNKKKKKQLLSSVWLM